MIDLPNLTEAVQLPSLANLTGPASSHPPRILLLYGSLRERSYTIRTSPLMRLNAQAGWARTFSRFYRLGVPLSKVDPVSRATFLAAAASKGFNRSPPDGVVEGMRHNRDLILKNLALFG